MSRTFHAPEGDTANKPRAVGLAGLKTPGWTLQGLKPHIHHWVAHNQDAVLACRKLPKVPGYAFPIKLTAQLTPTSKRTWFNLEFDVEFEANTDWPEVVQERRDRRPDWIRSPSNKIIGALPTPAGEDPSVPLQQILRVIVANGTVPTDKALLSEIGRHTAASEHIFKRPRNPKSSPARLEEIRNAYLDALADPTLTKQQRLDHVARVLGYDRPDSQVRAAVRRLEQAGRVRPPGYILPLNTKRIRYWIKPGNDINRVAFGGDPRIIGYADDEYQTTDFDTMRVIARHKHLEFEILE